MFVHGVVAQDNSPSTSNYARLFVGQIEPQYQLSLWHDIPYYNGTTDMYNGRISYYGVVYDNVQLRYDQLQQCVVVLSPVGNVYCLPEQEHIDWFEFDGHRYVHDPEDSSKYAALLCDGSTNGIRLYHSVWKVYRGDEAFGGKKYQKVLSIKEQYTLVNSNGEKYNVKNASDIASLFPEQKTQIKQTTKQNGLSFSKGKREVSLMKLVESLSGTPITISHLQSKEKEEANNQVALSSVPPTSIDENFLIAGIPVLDNDSVAKSVASSRGKTYVVPGVKKARASIADDQELAEIVVVGGRQSVVRSTIMGSEKFKPQLLKNIPSAFGETDIMKIVLTLPGVTNVGEASSGFNVRGGATDQNLILFNGGTVYNPSHLFGLFTSFNSNAIEDVELFKSSIPAEYGGRISSVLKVTSKEANMQKLTGTASIGVLTSKANLEIPIVKDHVSLLLNGRTTYSDWILKQLPEDSGYKNGTANFNDFGAVLTWKLNNMHRLKLYGYLSNDKFSFTSSDDYAYTNRNVSFEWRSLLSEKITATVSGGLDHYDYYNEDRTAPSMAARLSFAIDQLWGKLHIRQRINEKNTLSYGLSVQHYDVKPGKYVPVGEYSCLNPDELQKEKALESAAYVDYERSLTDKLSLLAGLRYSLFNALGPRDVNYYNDDELPTETSLTETRHETGIFKTYNAPEFRLSARYAIKENLALKAGFNTMHQYIHKVSNTSILETDVISTKGKSYGLELQAKKPFGKFNGWLSYTFSRSLLRQDDERVEKPLNDGDWYPSEYDRPHEVKAVLNYKITERYSFSGNFNYATGRPTTLPAGVYYDSYYQKKMPYYTERNKYRIPDYMRLDLAFNIEPTHKLTTFLHTSFSVGVYNALARKNAYNIYYVSEDSGVNGYKISVFGTAIPYVSLNIKFN